MRVKPKCTLPMALLILTSLLTGTSHAFSRVQPTAIEWDLLPDWCRSAGHTAGDDRSWKRPQGAQTSARKLSPAEGKLLWGIGGWHYCTGHIKVMRLESRPQRPDRDSLLKQAFGDINYSLSKISPEEPWAAQMAVTLARAFRVAREPEKALQVLDKYRPLHPRYAQLYLAYTVVYFDQKDYHSAVEVLEEGNRNTGDRIGELQYYLGLAHFRAGNIEQARLYADKARNNRYPFKALARKLAEYDAKNGKTPD